MRKDGRPAEADKHKTQGADGVWRVWPSWARRNHFSLDTTCYPWKAYKGNRDDPWECHFCFTRIEEENYNLAFGGGADEDEEPDEDDWRNDGPGHPDNYGDR